MFSHCSLFWSAPDINPVPPIIAARSAKTLRRFKPKLKILLRWWRTLCPRSFQVPFRMISLSFNVFIFQVFSMRSLTHLPRSLSLLFLQGAVRHRKVSTKKIALMARFQNARLMFIQSKDAALVYRMTHSDKFDLSFFHKVETKPSVPADVWFTKDSCLLSHGKLWMWRWRMDAGHEDKRRKGKLSVS